MAKTEENGRNRVEIDYPRDLLKTLVSPNHFPGKFEEEKVVGKEEIELSLSLSLNGRFGIDRRGLKLTRCSSIPDVNGGNGDEELIIQNESFLARACSLPTETTEEWRKRRELQSLRRTEAKRKRSEKQRNLRDNGGGEEEKHSNLLEKLFPLPPSSQGKNTSGEVKSLASNQSSPETDRKHPLKPENPVIRNVLVDMPCVSTKGEGPNERKIEGFLYRYRKGEEVRIVCVCHGRFLSPAEFVKHAGGGEVAHPLKHIVVSPSFL